LRLEPEHYVPALISRQSLPAGISPGTCANALFTKENGEPPTFYPEQPLVYLQGMHRLEAARRFWTKTEWWWIVNLYSDGTSTSKTLDPCG